MTKNIVMFDNNRRMLTEDEVNAIREAAVEGIENGERKKVERYFELLYNSGKVVCMQQCA